MTLHTIQERLEDLLRNYEGTLGDQLILIDVVHDLLIYLRAKEAMA